MKKTPVLVFLLLSVSLFSCISKDIEAHEKDLLLAVEDVTPYGFEYSNVSELEKFTKDVYVDGSTELTYEFESVETDESVLYLSHTVAFEASSTDARKTFDAYRVGMVIASLGFETEERNDIFTYGDGSDFRMVLGEGGEYVGNVFLYHEDKIAGMLIIVGLYFEDDFSMQEFIDPKYQAALTYSKSL